MCIPNTRDVLVQPREPRRFSNTVPQHKELADHREELLMDWLPCTQGANGAEWNRIGRVQATLAVTDIATQIPMSDR